MSYYAHPSARGGFSFKSVGKFVGKAVGIISNPIGSLTAGLTKQLSQPKQKVQETQFGSIKGGVLVPTKTDIAAGVYRMVDTGLAGLLPGGAPPFYAQGGQSAGACPPGWHLDKATRSKCVRNRSMNFSNGKATARSIRRLRGAEKSLKKVLRVMGKRVERVGPKGKARSK